MGKMLNEEKASLMFTGYHNKFEYHYTDKWPIHGKYGYVFRRQYTYVKVLRNKTKLDLELVKKLDRIAQIDKDLEWISGWTYYLHGENKKEIEKEIVRYDLQGGSGEKDIAWYEQNKICKANL